MLAAVKNTSHHESLRVVDNSYTTTMDSSLRYTIPSLNCYRCGCPRILIQCKPFLSERHVASTFSDACQSFQQRLSLFLRGGARFQHTINLQYCLRTLPGILVSFSTARSRACPYRWPGIYWSQSHLPGQLDLASNPPLQFCLHCRDTSDFRKRWSIPKPC